MISKLAVIFVAACAAVANAAVIDMFADQNCQQLVGTRNVYDNSCAEGVPGFQSYRITTGGSFGQVITSWSPDACAGPTTSCNDAGSITVCWPAFNSQGGSNAFSSSNVCGAV